MVELLIGSIGVVVGVLWAVLKMFAGLAIFWGLLSLVLDAYRYGAHPPRR